jgi:hypothetical protein
MNERVDGWMGGWVDLDVLLFVLKKTRKECHKTILTKVSLKIVEIFQYYNMSCKQIIQVVSGIDSIVGVCIMYLLKGLHNLATNNLLSSYCW